MLHAQMATCGSVGLLVQVGVFAPPPGEARCGARFPWIEPALDVFFRGARESAAKANKSARQGIDDINGIKWGKYTPGHDEVSLRFNDTTQAVEMTIAKVGWKFPDPLVGPHSFGGGGPHARCGFTRGASHAAAAAARGDLLCLARRCLHGPQPRRTWRAARLPGQLIPSLAPTHARRRARLMLHTSDPASWRCWKMP